MNRNPTLALVPNPTDATPPAHSIPWDTIEELLDRPIAFNRAYAAIAGGALAGLFLSQAVYWSKRTDNHQGWFWKVQDEWNEETAMTRSEQETVRKKLIARGLMEEQRRGLPAKLFYRINRLAVRQALEYYIAERAQSRLQDSRNQERGKATNKKAKKPQTLTRAENTTENTEETTTTSDVVEIENLLIARHVTPNVARDLATTNPTSARCWAQWIEYADDVKNVPAYLVRAIRGNWAAPPRWLAEQQTMQAARDAEIRAMRAHEEDKQKQREHDQREAAQQDANDQLDAFYKSLSVKQRKLIDDDARTRLGVLGTAGRAPAALAAMRRTLLIEMIQRNEEDENDE
jgi:hypothetical protein